MPPQPRLVRFATFEFDPDSGELTRQGRRVPLEGQPARALALLLTHAGAIVSRDDLKQALWNGDVHVDFDRGLAYCISQVRTALGDTADNPRFVETLPKRGFRFIAPVVASQASEAPALPTKDPGLRKGAPALLTLVLIAAVIAIVTFSLAGQRPMLAVAIFDNETGQPAHDGFVAGLSDALVVHLGTLDTTRIGVIGNARTLRMPRSARDLADITAETGASYILLGQLQNHEGGLRIFAHLIRLEDGTHVWVKRIDRPDGVLTGVEQDVLREVEAGVRKHVMGEWREPSPAPASR